MRAIIDNADGILVEREILTDGSAVFNLVIEVSDGSRPARIRTNCSEADASHLAKLLADRVISIEAA